MRSVVRPEIKFKVENDVIESVESVKIYGLNDVTGDFRLDIRAGGATCDFLSSLFHLYLVAISIKIGQLPQNGKPG